MYRKSDKYIRTILFPLLLLFVWTNHVINPMEIKQAETNLSPCVPTIQIFPKRASEKDEAPPLRSLQSLPIRLVNSSTSSSVRSDLWAAEIQKRWNVNLIIADI